MMRQTRVIVNTPSGIDMTELTPITVARGDGIGPEIMDATLRVLQAAGARIAPEFIDIGEQQYLAGHSSGIPPQAWESLRRTKVFLKARSEERRVGKECRL